MADIQFNEPQYGSRGSRPEKLSLMSRMVVGLGLASDERGAQQVLVVFVVVVIIAIVLIWVL